MSNRRWPAAAVLVWILAIIALVSGGRDEISSPSSTPSSPPPPEPELKFERLILGSCLDVRLKFPDTPLTAGRPFRAVAILKNVHARSVPVLRSLDGSSVDRFPRCRLWVRPPEGEWEEVPGWSECTHRNPLEERDFKDLAPGEELPLVTPMLGCWIPERPGTYELRFAYDTQSTDYRPWFGTLDRPTQGMVDRISRIPAGRFESPVYRVDVR